jgi:hypothetical protein
MCIVCERISCIVCARVWTYRVVIYIVYCFGNTLQVSVVKITCNVRALFSSRCSLEFHVSETRVRKLRLVCCHDLKLSEDIVSLMIDIVLVEMGNLFSEYHVLCR